MRTRPRGRRFAVPSPRPVVVAATAMCALAGPVPSTTAAHPALNAASAFSTAAQACVTPGPLGTPASTQQLAPGIRLRTWTVPTGEGTAHARLTVVDADLATARLSPRIRKLPDAVDPMRLAAGDEVVALVNSGYFEYLPDGDFEPIGPVATDGRIRYAPQGPARVVRLDADAATPVATTARLHGVLRAGGVSIPITAVNTTRLAATGATAYTQDWSRRSTPRAAIRLVIKGSAVQRVDFTSRRPATGTWTLQVPQKWQSQAATLRRGTRVRVALQLRDPHGTRIDTAVGRGPMVLTGGRLDSGCSPTAMQQRPRTLLAWDLHGHVWIATATSGQPDAGDGIRLGGTTPHQTAYWLQQLGADNAVTFDGGGSTILLARLGTRLTRVDHPPQVWRRPLPVGLAILRR